MHNILNAGADNRDYGGQRQNSGTNSYYNSGGGGNQQTGFKQNQDTGYNKRDGSGGGGYSRGQSNYNRGGRR